MKRSNLFLKSIFVFVDLIHIFSHELLNVYIFISRHDCGFCRWSAFRATCRTHSSQMRHRNSRASLGVCSAIFAVACGSSPTATILARLPWILLFDSFHLLSFLSNQPSLLFFWQYVRFKKIFALFKGFFTRSDRSCKTFDVWNHRSIFSFIYSNSWSWRFWCRNFRMFFRNLLNLRLWLFQGFLSSMNHWISWPISIWNYWRVFAKIFCFTTNRWRIFVVKLQFFFQYLLSFGWNFTA